MSLSRILTLSRLYPNKVMPIAGIYVERLVQAISAMCHVRVVAPVPYCPPLPRSLPQARFRDVPERSQTNSIEVLHPRFCTGPGYSLHSYEAHTYYWGVRRTVDRLRREFPFELIHAHMSYPDGVVAARLARLYDVPAMITEHAPWLPWMDAYPRVRRQAVWASRQCAFHIAVSRYTRDTIAHFTGESEHFRVVPVGVDGSLFSPEPDGVNGDPNLILYVGRIHRIKGIDVLLRAMCQLVVRRPKVRLRLVGGGSFFRDSVRQEHSLRAMAQGLDLGHHIEFAGEQAPSTIADLMRKCSVLVLPSRAESFGAVLVEAISCGTPVVATRCGGPEDIVNEQVGLLVDKEDPEALAVAIERVMERRGEYVPARLRAYALENFSWERIARRIVELYAAAIGNAPARRDILSDEG